MNNIFAIAKAAVASLGAPYAEGVYKSATPADLPEMFVVYTLVSSSQAQAADNAETMRAYTMQISIFSRSGLSNLPNVDSAMIAAGFIKSTERQLPCDVNSRHYGLAIDYVYLMEV